MSMPCVVSRQISQHLEEEALFDAEQERIEAEKQDKIDETAVCLREFRFKDIGKTALGSDDFYTWWRDVIEDGQYANEFNNLIDRNDQWINLDAAEVAADFVEWVLK